MGYNILVVEDDFMNQDLLSEQVEDLAEVQIASNGAHALQCIQQQRPDLIVLDLNMPQMNGFQFIERLRTIGHTIPIVIITAMDLRRADYDFFRTHQIARVFEKGRYSGDEFLTSVRTALQGA